jgi:REP element-mobilizing transposase RayT/AraC-like DNA-binding protein
MGRPLRIEYPGAIYHATSRGDRQEPIFRGADDKRLLLDIVDQAMGRLDAEMFAYCLMGNHYHFVLRTRKPNLSRLMRHINGEYTRAFNKRHSLVGHVFQGRYHAILVDSDAYLVNACRYVELNPVRAGLVDSVDAWPWSSYRAHVGLARTPCWLATEALHGHLLGRDVTTQDDRRRAEHLYADAVAAGKGADLWNDLRQEIFLGDETFAAASRTLASTRRLRCKEIAREQRIPSSDLADWLTPDRTRDEALRLAYSEGSLTMSEIARQANLSVSRVSRLIAAAERGQKARPDTAKGKT